MEQLMHRKGGGMDSSSFSNNNILVIIKKKSTFFKAVYCIGVLMIGTLPSSIVDTISHSFSSNFYLVDTFETSRRNFLTYFTCLL